MIRPICGEEKRGEKMRIYLAGPFFSEAQIKNVEYAESVLAKRGLDVFSPMRHTVDAPEGTSEWARGIFELDRNQIEKADAVLALYYGANSDTGTAWECGYAYALGKPVILVHVENADSNLMMHCGCRTNIELSGLESFDFAEMPVFDYEGKMY